MRCEITREFSDEHRQHLTAWRERVFPEEGVGKQWAETAWHILVYDTPALPIAHLGFDRFLLNADGVDQAVIGVGGVVVRPEYQGQGVPDLLFDTLHREAPDLCNTHAFALFCPERLVSYYLRHGYTPVAGEVFFQQFGQQVRSRFELMTYGVELGSARVDINSLPW
ncbi:MAG TPA: hypothetical protein VIC08_09290 [Cellvibrionaceae bacterium]